jgi:hypothetical protein
MHRQLTDHRVDADSGRGARSCSALTTVTLVTELASYHGLLCTMCDHGTQSAGRPRPTWRPVVQLAASISH